MLLRPIPTKAVSALKQECYGSLNLWLSRESANKILTLEYLSVATKTIWDALYWRNATLFYGRSFSFVIGKLTTVVSHNCIGFINAILCFRNVSFCLLNDAFIHLDYRVNVFKNWNKFIFTQPLYFIRSQADASAYQFLAFIFRRQVPI